MSKKCCHKIFPYKFSKVRSEKIGTLSKIYQKNLGKLFGSKKMSKKINTACQKDIVTKKIALDFQEK
jgi:hypothetical protein